jgi:hypothetical protein
MNNASKRALIDTRKLLIISSLRFSTKIVALNVAQSFPKDGTHHSVGRMPETKLPKSLSLYLPDNIIQRVLI